MNNELECIFTPALTYDIFLFKGEISIGSMITLTGEFNKYFGKNFTKDIVLELSNITSIDAAGARFLGNLKKRTDAVNKHIFLLKPSQPVLDMLNRLQLQNLFTVIDSNETLEKKLEKDTYDAFLPYTTDEKGLKRLSCSCAICGTTDVYGYLIGQNNLLWDWKGDSPFPIAIDKETKTEFPYFSTLPVICLECNMCSIKITDFNIVANDEIVFKSNLRDESRQLLAKSIKKRKRIMESIAIVERHFQYPRQPDIVYKCYQLAEFCARTSAMTKSHATAFDIGFLNYLCIQYAEQKAQEEHINNCRTWCTQTLSCEELPIHEKVVSYFILFLCNLNVNKAKEASQVLNTFSKLMENLPATITAEGFNSPFFWYKQAEVIWKKEILEKSTILKE